MSHVSPKEKERLFIRGIGIIIVFAVVGFVVTYPLPVAERSIPFWAILLSGFLASSLYVLPKVARDYKDILWGYSITAIIVILFAGAFSMGYLSNIGLVGKNESVLLVLGFFLPLSLISGFAIFEVVDFLKQDEKHGGHFKRFSGRIVLVIMIVAPFLSLSLLMSLIFPTHELSTPVLVVSSLITFTIILMATRKVSMKNLLHRLAEGD